MLEHRLPRLFGSINYYRIYRLTGVLQKLASSAISQAKNKACNRRPEPVRLEFAEIYLAAILVTM
jgi:transcription initiation factor TFIIIB Brf1 subunit/transcription initiation factor TFIIB